MSNLIRAVRCHRYAGLDEEGNPVPTPDPLRDVLALDEIPLPECEEGHVLVLTNYASIQYPDALQAQGLYQQKPSLPYVPGMDVTGTVLGTGAGVERVLPGNKKGGFRQCLRSLASHSLRLPLSQLFHPRFHAIGFVDGRSSLV